MTFSPTSSRTASGGGTKVFDQTLGSDTASIDTGAAGIPSGYDLILVYIIAQVDSASGVAVADVNVNADTSAIYDYQLLQGSNASVVAGNNAGQTKWAVNLHDTAGTSGYPGCVQIAIPGYTGTAFNKVGVLSYLVADATAANGRSAQLSLGYRSTSAITRMSIAAQGANKLKAGSRMFILAF